MQYLKSSNDSICSKCANVQSSRLPFCSRCGFDIKLGSLNRPTRGKCLYCDASYLSKEHIFGKWLARKYRKKSGAEWLRRLIRPEEVWQPGTRVHQVIEGDGSHPYFQTVSNVCQTCNGSWMSAIHTNAKPHITALSEGTWSTLDEEARVAITRWAIMVCINIQSYARFVHSTENQRAELKEGKVPSGFRVFVMRMEDSRSGGFHEHRVRSTDPVVEPQVVNFVGSTFFVIERVAFHLIYGLGDRLLDLGLRYSGLRYEVFTERMIWPEALSIGMADSIQYNEFDITVLNSLFAPRPMAETSTFRSDALKWKENFILHRD